MKAREKILWLILVVLVSIFLYGIISGKSGLFKKDSAFKNLLYPLQKLSQKEKSVIKVPILMYHYVEYVKDKNDFIRESLNITPAVFESQIVSLKNAGYIFITPREIPYLFDGGSTNLKYAILSFDDGYQDFYTDVLPILRNQRAKAVNYVVYNYIGGSNYMTKAQIKDCIQTNLVEIGSHSLSHFSMDQLDEETAYNEAFKSRQNLEKDFGVEILSFAYPQGKYTQKTIEMVKKAGYTTAVTSELGNLVTKNNLFELKRIRPGILTEQELISLIESP